LLAAEATGEDFPGDFGCDGDGSRWGLAGLRPGARIELPGAGTAQGPVASCFTGDRKLNGCACRGLHLVERVGQRADEGVQDRGEQARRIEAGAVGGVTNLLLVVPALGVFAGEIEPVGRGIGAGPADRRTQRERIEAQEIFVGLPAGVVQQVTQDLRAEALGGCDPGLIDAIDEGDQIVPVGDGASGRRVMIAAAGKIAEIAAQDVEGDVFYGPLARGRGSAPIVRPEAVEQGQEMVPEFGEQAGDQDRGWGIHDGFLVIMRQSGGAPVGFSLGAGKRVLVQGAARSIFC
jgi:hypothetical protein